MPFALILSGVSVFSFWATQKVHAIGEKFFPTKKPTSSFMGLNLTPAQPTSTKSFNPWILVIGVGGIFGLGYLLRGVGSVLKA